MYDACKPVEPSLIFIATESNYLQKRPPTTPSPPPTPFRNPAIPHSD